MKVLWLSVGSRINRLLLLLKAKKFRCLDVM
ncbi:hypothetical protein pdam_00022998 [Pocillopora damicornis]|uniref:Uncharacterized protein n=1 Tax=Pocillopora damicornis TaxID=46731 RepID=A0A3M6TBV7_POCDA|nr:hypothetical protein pdam_00022998 [Pocillopora damicornis]